MQLGPGLNVDWQDLEDAVGVGPGKPLKEGDLDLQDKQNWAATDRIFSFETLAYLLGKIEEKEAQGRASVGGGISAADAATQPYKGTYTFI